MIIDDSFICLFAICTHSLEKCSVPIFNWVFGGSIVSVLHPFWIWTPFQIILFANIFSRSGCLSFCEWFPFQLDGVPFVLLLFFLLGGTDPENISRTDVCVLPVFSSSSFMASGITLKSLIHCEVPFADGMRKDSSVLLVHVCAVFPPLFPEETLFSTLCSPNSFVTDELTIYIYSYFWALNSVPWVYVCILFSYHTILIIIIIVVYFEIKEGFPGGSDDEESACNSGDLGSIPGLGRSPGEGNGNPLQYSCC